MYHPSGFSIRLCHRASRSYVWLPIQQRSAFSSSSRHRSYADTIPNLKIGSHTRVIYQGFTGKQATANAKASIEWGTKVVGGVTPGRDGEHLGLPVLPSVQKAVDQLKPDATAIFVAAQHAAGAIEEAIAAEVPLIIAVAEHVPLHDMLRVCRVKLPSSYPTND
jgi:succinyl-CoA synthetase alpha subunit